MMFSDLLMKLKNCENDKERLKILKIEKAFWVSVRQKTKRSHNQRPIFMSVTDHYAQHLNLIHILEDLFRGQLMLHRKAPMSHKLTNNIAVIMKDLRNIQRFEKY